jgi:hypothetical protein
MKRIAAGARVAELNRLASVYRSQSTEPVGAPRIQCRSLEYDDAD